jgi:hypothetical protein
VVGAGVSYITERRSRARYWIGGNQPPTGRPP